TSFNTKEFEVMAKEVFLVTYSKINETLAHSHLPIIPLRHEFTEMALVSVPEELQGLAVTVMDGPFWSMMPFPCRGLASLSHVRHTPHYQWSDEETFNPTANGELIKKTAFNFMIKDAARFVPLMSQVKHEDSLWEVKTILPRSDENDSRPILFQRDCGLKGLHIVLGGKIDNIFDIISLIKQNPMKQDRK
ncbi:MAG TPA: hypothetical protein VIG33_09290, partial [Pseudobdellovibrionaceae bacterium]